LVVLFEGRQYQSLATIKCLVYYCKHQKQCAVFVTLHLQPTCIHLTPRYIPLTSLYKLETILTYTLMY